ncbi:MAG TPA: SRPBCC domain-containing protein [Candidatus Dormibacteraeota bacterium]|nr:SRPBCC domain-containing protein [Candidatus Dormibacteraeota bacterium]
MQIEFGGAFEVKKKIDEVYEFLADPDRFCPLLPDFQSMKKEDATHFSVTLRVGISHIKGSAIVKMALEEASHPSHALYVGKGEVPGGTATIRAEFDLESVPQGTKVNWKGQSQIVGRLPSLAGGLLEPLARKNVQRLIESLQTALT